MGSWVLVSMGRRWQICVCVVIAVLGGVIQGTEDGRTYGWSALSFLSGQNNKRSADDAKENGVVADMSGSESKIEAEALIASDPDPESRMQPYRRRRNKYRNKKRPTNPTVPSQDFYEDKIYEDTYYDRDSSYQAPSSGYKAPSSSYEGPSSYEAPSYDPPSYKPAPSYEAPSYSGGGGGDSFNDFLNALAAFLPIGLFLAAIPPNLIVIN